MADMESRINQISRLHTRLENGTAVVNKTDAGWKLLDLFSRLRQLRRRVPFAQAFTETPQVVLGITLLDLPGEKIRCQVHPEEIDPQGFTLVFETRSDARVEEMQVQWLAYGRAE
ncbi:MAG: H-type lectin domain-containing protein [Magnetococcus sp. YQC-3]